MEETVEGVRVLIVEDEALLQRALVKMLQEAGYAAEGCATKAQARALLHGDAPYAAVLLDRRLPDGDGLDLCREMREADLKVPVIVITHLCDDEEVVEGFQAGADDYVIKPPSGAVLRARLAAVLRRRPSRLAGSETMSIEPLQGRIVLRDGLNEQHIALSTRELRLLTILADHAETVVPRPMLVEAVWGPGAGVGDNTIDAALTRLRRKLGSRGDAIVTVKGAGIMLRKTALHRP
ncbi:MAG: response regulator transcription factor [Polyangiaceae bacterium]|nr:response regulator transcription factor [Polyangiaceae bacterium]